MTPTYAELQAQIAALTARADAARRAELASVIAEIQQKMADYGITLEDLGGKRASFRKGRTVAPKYRHPTTGQTWTGRGKHPRWLAAEIAAGQDITAFAIA
ncbi:Histone family protein nucleoid-structuring protein H-NS [Thiomonas sp. X19]|uniref:H-NS histone family protein n=1 Tax=Thiomonas sp. X19 TaxID=1050370 RepID=UPI000B69462F|nr:H-NS histone family protein [Thiomonas sp. X19]SCC93788.1 Histone family protein nucleoid-structuring protein H-NS [Thiomonas sp. X19]SCC94353.1 Histone family protein nucleoid-structuring protein H-NS [Thiomonas sp. X19]SCC94358.1 Histone family protein nucleoid-structuring protein H-NS [Thiomonas sp. X19]